MTIFVPNSNNMSDSFTIKGKLTKIGEQTEIQTQKGALAKRSITVTTHGDYPVDLPVEFIGEKADIPTNYSVGNTVECSVNLRSYTTRDGDLRMGTPTCWRMTGEGAAVASGKAKTSAASEDVPF